MTGQFTILPAEEFPDIVCSCCAGQPGMRGEVHANGQVCALYLAEPVGMPGYPLLKLGLVVGPWGETSRPEERMSVAFSCRPGMTGPAVEMIEPWLATFPEFTQLGRPTAWGDALSGGRSDELCHMARAIITGDPRLVEIAKGNASHRLFRADATGTAPPR